MIISRTPLRISLGGGGTDIPSYYTKNGGFLVAAAINKYIYISIHPNFEPRYSLRYSQIENVPSITKIKHPFFRNALSMLEIEKGIEISSLADIPAGTGLGSSGTFSVGMLKALYAFKGKYVTNEYIAKEACRLEMDILRNPTGKQDQYIAAIGGLTCFEFRKDGSVEARSVALRNSDLDDLQENLLLFYTGIQRSASEEMAPLGKNGSTLKSKVSENLDNVKKAGYRAVEMLEMGRLEKYAEMLTHQWKLKLERSPTSINRKIDALITQGIDSGALGGKLIGAGGGGFLMFYAEKKSELRKKMNILGLREVTFRFDFVGTTLIER